MNNEVSEKKVYLNIKSGETEFVFNSKNRFRDWKVKVKSLNCARLFVTPWTVAYQVPPAMEFSRQDYWSGLPFLLQGIFLIQG